MPPPRITSTKAAIFLVAGFFIYRTTQAAFPLTLQGYAVVFLVLALAVYLLPEVGKVVLKVRHYDLGLLEIDDIGKDRSKLRALYNIEKNPKNPNRLFTSLMDWQAMRLEHSAEYRKKVAEDYVPEDWEDEWLSQWEIQQYARQDINRNMRESVDSQTINVNVIRIPVYPKNPEGGEKNEKNDGSD